MTLMIFAFKILLAEKCYGGVLTQEKLPNALSFTHEAFVFLKHGLFRSSVFVSDQAGFIFRLQDFLLCLVKATARLTGTS